MRKFLFLSIACLCFVGVNFASITGNDSNKKVDYKENVELTSENIELNLESINLNSADLPCKYDCQSDDYCNGCLLSTYHTEYCVGTRCRDRTLYECNICKEQYWIYH